MKVKGNAIVFGDNIDTDVIIPARYLNSFTEETLKSHCMEDIDPTFASRVKQGDVMIGGENFGCGSSREHAPLAIKYSGISCVVAKSYARIFYRNAINIGLPILVIPEADKIKEGDDVEIDFDTGEIVVNGRERYRSQPFPEFVQKIVSAGGLINLLKQEGDIR